MIKFGSLFSGIGTIEMGLPYQFKTVLGCEIEQKTRKVYQHLHNPEILNTDVMNILNLPNIDWLHLSPPCQSFSVNKSGNRETDRDIYLIRDVCRILNNSNQPKMITVENVPGYLKSQSFANLTSFLKKQGYFAQIKVYDSYDFGVPQHRKRVWVIFTQKNELIAATLPKHQGWYCELFKAGVGTELTNTQLKTLSNRGCLPELCLIPRTSIGRRMVKPILPNEPIPTFTRGNGSCAYPFTVCVNGHFFHCQPELIYRCFGLSQEWQDKLKHLVDKGKVTQRQINQMLGNGVTPPIVSYLADYYLDEIH